MKTSRFFSLLLFAGLFLPGCVQDKLEVEEIPFEYYTQEELSTLQAKFSLNEIPDIYNSATITNPENRKGTFGRVLFYDKQLSSDKSVSCASCHDQSKGFADDKAFSDGPENRKTTRNSLALGGVPSFQNYNGSSFLPDKFFWDERATSLSDQTEETIQNPDEMGLEMDEVLDYVKSQKEYQILHKYAFPNKSIRKQHVLDALGVFMNSIHAENTKFNEAFNKTGTINNDMVGFTNIENIGRSLFVENCNSCHGFSIAGLPFSSSGQLQSTVANNGLELLNSEDLGVGSLNGHTTDEGKFKIPGLRNVELTAPFMHDGRFATLEEVVEHYNSGIVNHPNLHENLKASNGEPKRLNLTSEEKGALVAFLKTLTDHTMAEEIIWSDPFIN